MTRLHQILSLASCGVIATTLSAPADVKNAYDVFPSLRKNIACMTMVLKTTPNVYQVETGIWHDGGWDYPLVRYRYTDYKRSGTSTIQFIAQQTYNNGPVIYFMTTLRGIFPPRDSGPPDFGTKKVSRAWKEKCGVDASILYD
jgi:hypothetical protein